MATYRKYNWPELFEAFELSESTQTEFCKQRSINPKYFNIKLNQHRKVTEKPSGFTRLQIAPSSHLTSGTSTSQVVIEYGQCKIHCPDSMSSSAMADLVRQLT